MLRSKTFQITLVHLTELHQRFTQTLCLTNDKTLFNSELNFTQINAEHHLFTYECQCFNTEGINYIELYCRVVLVK